MTRKRYNKLCVALCEKLQNEKGQHLNGESLKFYRDREHRINGVVLNVKSYNDAWKLLKDVREIVGM